MYYLANKTNLGSDLITNHKFENIEGLRGLAAMLVIFHHSILANENALSGSWKFPQIEKMGNSIWIEGFYHNSGPVGVVVFFMITGFLFSNKLITSKGEVNYLDFYKKRIIRVAPLYYFSVMIVFLISIFMPLNYPSGFLDGVRKFFGWLTFYFIGYEGFTTSFPYSRLNAGVFWTLAVEWKFYFIIPFLGIFARTLKQSFIFFVVAAMLTIILNNASLIKNMESAIIISFLIGLLASILNKFDYLHKIMRSWHLSVVPVLCMFFIILSPTGVYNNVSVSILGVAFILISCGNNVFGLMSSRALKSAGVISYSVYLLHGIILNMLNYFLAEELSRSLINITAVIAIPLTCTASYLFIEKPFMTKKQ
jgi:peptidoglycan/LPS O-acetylase OafA/YrhL